MDHAFEMEYYKKKIYEKEFYIEQYILHIILYMHCSINYTKLNLF